MKKQETPAQASKTVSVSASVVQGVGWSYASAILSGVLRILALSVLARLLSPREFGLLGIAMIFVNFSERIAQVGLGPALVQRIQVTQRHCIAAAYVGILGGVAIFAVLWVGSPFIAEFFKEPEVVSLLRALGILFVLEGLAVVPDSILQRQLRFRALMTIENVSYALGSGALSILLAWMGFGVWSLVAGVIAVRAFRVIMLNVLVPQPVTLTDCRREIRDLLGMGAGYSLGRILNFCALYGDNFVIGRMLGTVPLGIYSRAYQLMSIPSMYFAQVLDRVLFPVLAQKQEDSDNIRKAFLQTLEVVSYAAFPAMAFMVFLSRETVLVLFGERWTPVIPVLQILSLGVFFRTAYKVGDILSRSLGAVYQHAIRQGVYTILVVCGAFLGSNWNGIEGVSWAVLFAVAMNYFLMLILSVRLVHTTWSEVFRVHVPGAWVAGVMSLALYLSTSILREMELPPIVVLVSGTAVGCAAAYVSAAWAPAICSLRSSQWLLTHLPFRRLGRAGSIGIFVFERQLRRMEAAELRI